MDQAVVHGAFQGMMSIEGGKFWSSFAAGAISSIAGSAYGWDGNGAAEGLGWGNSVRDSSVGMIAFGTVSGGAGAVLTGGNFWQGAVTGLIVLGLNHAMHEIEEGSILDERITKAGFNPEDVARWTNEELTTNMAKIFPELYESANCPTFEIQDVIGGQDNIYGQAQKSTTGTPGNYKTISKGLIYIKKLALNTVRHAASVAGHELNHMTDFVNGNYSNWANQYGINGLKYANIRSEIGAYSWEMGMGSPFTNYSELMLNYGKMTTNNWKF